MTDLLEAYDGVVSSSTDIIKNKQRHLYINMLDLLTTTTRAAGVSTNITISDGICLFWYSDVLPICFDNDIRIQNSAIDSLDTFVSNIDSMQFHNSPKWPQLKQQIVDNYISKLNKMRDEANCNWYKIWCLLIRILNQEIIRSASIINTFLSVVEQGFRSSNYEIRSEAFICWKVLIEIFSNNNELISPKRIKLISIPLRSSQAKTMSTAINKFKVWWYFLLQLNDNIHNNCEMTFEPFLQFCFGISTINHNNSGGQLKQFTVAKEMAVISLIELLGSSHKEIHLLLEKFELEQTEETLITESIMQKSYKYIIKGCFEATLIITEQFSNRTKLIELLWRNLISQIIRTKNSEIYKECCISIKELIQTDCDNKDINIKTDILQICNIFGTHYAFLLTTFNDGDNKFDLNKISETITDFTDVLLSSGNLYFNIDNYKPIIRNIYDIDEYKESTKYWDMIKNLIENLLKSDEIDNFNNFGIKLEIWKTLSLPIMTYLDIKLFEFRLIKKAELINNWLLWPLNKIVLTKLSFDAIQTDLKLLDDDFFNIWKKLMVSSSNAQGRSNFQLSVFEKFFNFAENRTKLPKCQDILGCYINCCEKKFDSTSAPKEILDLIKNFLTKPPSQKNENYNKIIEYVIEYFSSLEESKIVIIFNRIITLTKQIIQAEQMKYITKSCFDNYKKNIIEKLKSDKIDKKFLREFKNTLKNLEIFTVIPKVWALNPEKLTEHQVEKMKEKNCDIPALYNDINSLSEDASNSIKPWTPNKIIISKTKDSEQVVLPGRSEVIINSPRGSKTSLVSEDFKTPKPVDSIIKAYCEISDTNDSSSTITDKSLTIIDMERNITVSPGKNKRMPKKKLNSTTLKKITKKDEILLKKLNIQINDDKKKLSILRHLKSMSIDTVEGKKYFQKSLSEDLEAPSIITRGLENKIKTGEGINTKKNLRAARKSLNFPNINPEPINIDCDTHLLSTKSNISLNNSDDDIVVSSQISESLITRRGRKSSSSLLNINQDSKTTMVTEPTEAIINDSEQSVPDVGSLDGTMLNKNAPIILANQLINLSEMDTQLNTENVSIIDLNTTTKQSPIKSVLKSLRNNQLTSSSPDKQSQKNTIMHNESLTSHHNEESSSSNSSLLNNVAYELFVGKSKINCSITKNSPQSESAKELKSHLTSRNSAQIEQEHEQQNYSKSCLSPINNNKIKEVEPKPPSTTLRTSTSQKEDLKKVSELEIQENTEEIINNSVSDNEKEIANDEEMPVTPKHRKINMNIIEETVIKSPVYSPIKPIKKLLGKANNTIVTTPACEDGDRINAELLNISPINKPLKLLDEGNNSIVTSPESANVNKRNTEFLNNTLNISPIQVTPYKNNVERNANVEETKIGEEFIKTQDLTDMIEKQQLSPIQKLNKPAVGLSSPPNRKSTNNASSPGPKPKQPTPNLTGRGAQLINMIRNRKLTSPAKRISNTLMNIRNDDLEIINAGELQNMQSSTTQGSDIGIVVFSGSTVPVTPQQLPRDLLVFSTVLPSPSASPSASILKRKCYNDSIDDFESPATKRKRVSFHDPPVSVTKEYVKNDDEESPKISVRMALNKFLQSSTPHTNQQNIGSNIRQQQQPQQLQNSSKHTLKRKSRANSMMELLRFNELPNKNQQKKSVLSKLSTAQITPQLQEFSEVNNYEEGKNSHNTQQQISIDNIDSFKWKTTDEMSNTGTPPIIESSLPSSSTTTINNVTEKTSTISDVQQDDYEPSLTPSPQIYFPDEAAIFKHIFDKYTIDNIFEKYCENGYDINNKHVRNIIKEISTKMELNNKIKSNVLEMLSEKHPKEFLDHAIQENLSSVVCDRLNSSSVIDFVFEKSKINTGVRKIVFEKMESIVSMDRFTRERHEFFMTMLRNEKLTNDEILECIEIISSKRMRNTNGRGDGAVVSTSEAVDSSSVY